MPSPIEALLKTNGAHLVLYGFVRGALYFTGNGVAINRIIRAYLDIINPDMSEATAEQAYARMQERIREAEKS